MVLASSLGSLWHIIGGIMGPMWHIITLPFLLYLDDI